ncbi:serine/threonine-protein phosphatase 6 regulatory ankyrin repeat subunit B [Patella vulgata]|uniref:serine/threonine-protein phosphatase 6 regulatory ankyrin repeat subunit B n=1 Tax=Patella vulgata TaxID=6465 RepID=UPI00217F3CB9|nr:serine/threonine-protein phosphatase 6 regulatory ankyrin repeat subunit B [Patella vulgata]XP_055957304.1 serine/threonine-protein phosphatase 6 regulatory ankyrin repeat subunit B [Patella vulgata]
METRNKLRQLAGKGNHKQLKKFLTDTNTKAVKQRINEPDESTGTTPIIECVKAAGSIVCEPGEGFGWCVKSFAAVGANLNFRDKSERTCLHWAVENKNDSLVSILVELGADCKLRDQNGLNPFHWAVRTGDMECAGVILKLQPHIVNVPDVSGTPPIVMSLQKGEYEMCRLLLSGGANINTQEKRSQRSALYYALFLNQLDLFEDMLEKADIRISDHRKTTIIHRCCAVPSPDYLKTIFKVLPDIPLSVVNMPDAEGASAVITACQNGNFEHLKILVDRGASVSLRDKCKRTALHHCADNLEDTRCAELVLRKDPSLLNIEDYEGLNPLHLAVITGNIPLIRLLLKRGADLTCQDHAKHTVAHWATVRGLSEVLRILIKYGANIHTPDAHKASPLHYAAQVVEPDGTQETCEDGTDVLRMLLQHDSAVNAKDDDGRTPVLWAASAGNTEACIILIEAGADVNIVDKHGLTAVHCAASRGHTAILHCLIKEHKVKVDSVDRNHCTALFYAITLGNMECMKLLIELGANLSHLDTRGRTPAHCAAGKGSTEALDLLHARNVDLWKRSIKGDLPLHEAALAGHVDVVAFLLKNRPADKSVDILDKAGRSCLHLAALTNNVWLCKYLYDAGATINLLMKSKGKYYTPYDAALAKNNKEAAEYIRTKGGKTGISITHHSARVIQRNFRHKYGRPKSSRPRSRSPGLDGRRKSSVGSPYQGERRSSHRPGSGENVSPMRKNTLRPEDNKMGSSASKDDNSRKISNDSIDSVTEPKPKKTSRQNKLIEEVQASVRRYEAERKYIRQLHQMRRAQLYMSPMYDVGLYKHMQGDTERSATAAGNKEGEESSLKSLSQWDEYVEDQCKFVSHIHEDKKPSYRRVQSAAQRQHKKLQSEINTAKKQTDERCEKRRKQAQKQEEKLEAEKKKKEREIELAVKRTEDMYNNIDNQASNILETAQNYNKAERERIKEEQQKLKPKSSKSPRTEPKQEKIVQLSEYEQAEKERRHNYREWQKKRSEDLRKRLLHAYRPYLPHDLFSDDKRPFDIITKSTCSRPTTSFSYNSVRSRPTSTFSKKSQRETTNVMTAYGSRKIVIENGYKDNRSTQNGSVRPRDTLVFLPPEEYEAKEKQRKQREQEYRNQQQGQQHIETCA